MNARHVALFMPSMRGGGAERVMLNLVYGLVERDVQVDLVLAQEDGTYLSRVPEAVRIVDLRAKRVLTCIPALRRYLVQERPGTLLAAVAHTNLAALVARKLSKVPTRIVIGIHNTFSIASQGAAMKRSRALPYVARWLYPYADGIVAVSQGVAEDLAQTVRMDRSRIEVVYNPVVTPELYQQADEPLSHPWFANAGSAHAELGDETVPVILGVGRLSAQKNFPLLLRAVAKVREKRPVRLLILGEGDDRAALEALVHDLGLSDCVALPGFVDNPFAYMRNAQLFVLSSDWEGLPTVLIEALACGCPVVSTDCPSGPMEILDGGAYGPLVPMRDENALADAMLASLDKPIRGELLQQRINEFTLDYATEQYTKVLHL
ncbi:glycosyltransferase [Candidatus Entotheonella palauensis]|uniref:Glycosyl transferase family 1 n=1 Tax=Candidatus Entotheonella gemina TaxID=1429439 RepID=W4M1A9_9BACT|nr:glycosyltransferase [Candidatus Entotheonella palauensis]ETX03975.1 MAG: glycosyl transferase family 1 [Candidatus Entotheonella gemina]